MKKIVLFFLLVSLSFASFCQAPVLWEPPVLSNPTEVILTSANISNNLINLTFDHNEDVLITASEVLNCKLSIHGGRKIHLRGLHIEATKPVIPYDNAGELVEIYDGSEIFFEGCIIDIWDVCADGIVWHNNRDYTKDQFRVTLQNCWLGTPEYCDNTHGDVLQSQIGKGLTLPEGFSVYLQNITAITNGQGFFLDYRTGGGAYAEYDHVFIKRGEDPIFGKNLVLIWGGRDIGTSQLYPISFNNVWAEDEGNNAFRPLPDMCDGVVIGDDVITFTPGTRADDLYEGQINLGTPPQPFVTKSQLGLNYNRSEIQNAITGFENVKSQVYPNPFSGSFTLRLSEDIILSDAEINIFDLTGKVISTRPVLHHETRISGADMSNGFYYYTLLMNKKVIATGKIVYQE